MMNVFRAVENRKAVLVSANSGVSGIIEASGRITASTKVMKPEIIRGEFLQNDYISFYTGNGDFFIKICAVLFLLMLVTILIIKKQK
jgi:apolipoprotein N-acyltransferase